MNQLPNDLNNDNHKLTETSELLADKAIIIAAVIHMSGWFLGFISSLIAYCVVEDKFIKSHAKEALNFQLNILMYALFFISASILTVPAVFIDPTGIVFFLLASISTALFVFGIVIFIVYPIIGAVKASAGKKYRFPFIVRFIG